MRVWRLKIPCRQCISPASVSRATRSICSFRHTETITTPSHSREPIYRTSIRHRSTSTTNHSKAEDLPCSVVDLSKSDLEPEAGPSSSSITLRPYQETAITKCLEALEEGTTRMGVSSPTGSGKTTMFMKLIPRVVEKEGKRKQTLILVSAVELASQSVNAARRILGEGWSVELDQGVKKATGLADVTVATYQTLQREGRLDKYDPANFGLVIVDEAHHSAAKSYLRVLHHFHRDVQLPASVEPVTTRDHPHRVPIVGFSATFSRPDQLALSAAYEKIVFHREIGPMLQEGWLSPAKATSVKADLDLKGIKTGANGDFNIGELASKMDTPQTNQLIVRSYQHLAKDRRSTLIFCVDLNHVNSLTDAFRRAGIDARAVSSFSTATHRKDTLAAFLNQEFPVLVNCEVLTEGADIPVIDCVILARPTQSKNLLAQMVGRGLRLSPATGKTDCHIIDISDNLSRGLMVSPTLLGLTHDAIEEESKERLEAQDKAVDVVEDGPKGKGRFNVHFIDESDPFEIGEARHKFRPVQQMTHNSWIACGKGVYVMDLMRRGDYLRIDQTDPEDGEEGQYKILYYTSPPPFWGGKKGYKISRTIAFADDLPRAFSTADVFAAQKVGRTASLLLARNAPWRTKPASAKQIDMLLTFKGVEAVDKPDGSRATEVRMLNRVVPVSAITMGMVSSYFTAAKRGAFTERSKTDAKEEAAEARRVAQEEKRNLRDLPLPLTE